MKNEKSVSETFFSNPEEGEEDTDGVLEDEVSENEHEKNTDEDGMFDEEEGEETVGGENEED